MGIKDLEFDVVSDEYRQQTPARASRLSSPLIQKLLNNETVFIKNVTDSRKLTSFYDIARRNKRKMHMQRTLIEDIPGYVLWMEPTEQEQQTNA